MHPAALTLILLAHNITLLSPRFGLPSIVQTGSAFTIEVLAGSPAMRAVLLEGDLSNDEAEHCAAGSVVVGCRLLTLVPGARDGQWRASAGVKLPNGAYDLFVMGAGDVPQRARKAVWIRDEDPKAVRPLTVIALSDLHVGKSAAIERRLLETIAEVNSLAPDLVIVSGDVADNGENELMEAHAAELLGLLESPVFVMPGNHDLSFGPRAMVHGAYKVGWPIFARAFHPALLAEVELGGWRFVGFDSGASEYTPFNHTRGLSTDALRALGAVLDRSQSDQGVFLFSHAPSRARMTLGCDPWISGPFGKMRLGGQELEALLLSARPRSIYVAGHTHWGDLFEARGNGAKLAFRQSVETDGALGAHATMVNVQSATHHGYFRKSAKGWGFARFVLNDGEPRLTLSRKGL